MLELGKVLRVGVSASTKTMQIMDRFEGLDEKGEKFDTLQLRGLFVVGNNPYYYADLLIVRADWTKDIVRSDITFSYLKKNIMMNFFSKRYCPEEMMKAIPFLEELIEYVESLQGKRVNELIYEFKRPVLFRAQNQTNRTGYGNEYCGEIQTHIGTLYGETTSYMIVAAVLNN